MKKLKIVFAAVALVAAGSVSAQTLGDLSAKLTEAADAAKAKNFAAAIPLFEEVIDKGLDVEGGDTFVAQAKQLLPTAVFQVGGSAFQGGRLDEALASFTKAAELAELYGNVSILNNARTWIGRTVLRQGADAFNAKDYATAAAIFQKGYDSNPNDTNVALNLAMSYSGLKDFAKSAEIYKNLIALGEQDERFAEAAAKARENYTLDVLEEASESAKAGSFLPSRRRRYGRSARRHSERCRRQSHPSASLQQHEKLCQSDRVGRRHRRSAGHRRGTLDRQLPCGRRLPEQRELSESHRILPQGHRRR